MHRKKTHTKKTLLTIQNALEKDDGQYPHAPLLSISKLRFVFAHCTLFLQNPPPLRRNMNICN